MLIEVLNERPEQVVMEKAKHVNTETLSDIQESGPYRRPSWASCHLHCCLATATHKLDMELRTLSLTTADSREFSSKRISGKIPGTSNLAAWYFSAINDLWEICTIYKSKKSLASQQITQKQEGKYFTSTLDSAFLTFQSPRHHPGCSRQMRFHKAYKTLYVPLEIHKHQNPPFTLSLPR